jgi:hypothetical protein
MGKQLAINLLRLQKESIRSREDKDDVDGDNIGSLGACSSRLPTSIFRRNGFCVPIFTVAAFIWGTRATKTESG